MIDRRLAVVAILALLAAVRALLRGDGGVFNVLQ